MGLKPILAKLTNGNQKADRYLIPFLVALAVGGLHTLFTAHPGALTAATSVAAAAGVQMTDQTLNGWITTGLIGLATLLENNISVPGFLAKPPERPTKPQPTGHPKPAPEGKGPAPLGAPGLDLLRPYGYQQPQAITTTTSGSVFEDFSSYPKAPPLEPLTADPTTIDPPQEHFHALEETPCDGSCTVPNLVQEARSAEPALVPDPTVLDGQTGLLLVESLPEQPMVPVEPTEMPKPVSSVPLPTENPV